MPPEQSGIADYSFELLEQLREFVTVTAVVEDARVDAAEAPLGVRILGASEARDENFDCNVYQMGNNSRYHRFVFRRALDSPGLVVLHDPSLLDYHFEICGGKRSPVFLEEVDYDRPDLAGLPLPMVSFGARERTFDRLELLMARRLVESSRRTLVNSEKMAGLLRRRYPGNDIDSILLPAPISPVPVQEQPASNDRVVFGVFGGINYYKRVKSAVKAFAIVHRYHPNTQMVVAGRADDRRLTSELKALEAGELRGALRIETDLTLNELESEMTACDVAIQLRWPTAGETSATLMRCFALGKPAIVTDVPQFRELDATYCWLVPETVKEEEIRLVSLMTEVAAHPNRARDAGAKAREFVRAKANYRAVAERYAAHIESCRTTPPHRPGPKWHLRARVNVAVAATSRPEIHRAAMRLEEIVREAGLEGDFVEFSVDSLAGPAKVQTDAGDAGSKVYASRRRNRFVHGVVTVALLVVDEALIDPLSSWVARETDRLGTLVVGYVAPEATTVGESVAEFLTTLDDVWTPSHFAAQVVQPHARRQVLTLPLVGSSSLGAIGSSPRSAKGRHAQFLLIADGGASVTRANIRETLRACHLAFRDEGRVDITLAASQLTEAATQSLRRMAEAFGARFVLVRRECPLSAIMADCDVYVSLHHSETFAEPIWRAIALGKQVVATSGFGSPDGLASLRIAGVKPSPAPIQLDDFYLEPDAAGRFSADQEWARPALLEAVTVLREAAHASRETIRPLVVRPDFKAIIDRTEFLQREPSGPSRRP